MAGIIRKTKGYCIPFLEEYDRETTLFNVCDGLNQLAWHRNLKRFKNPEQIATPMPIRDLDILAISEEDEEFAEMFLGGENK